MPIDHASHQDGGDGDTIGDFANQWGGAAQGGRSNICAGVAVCYDGNDEIHAYVDALEEEESFGILFGVLELGDEGKEGNMA